MRRQKPKGTWTPAPGRDISERSRIWQALLESEDRYRATFDYAPVGIMHTSVDSDRILRANPKLSEMLGYTESELLRLTTDDILRPDDTGTDRPKYRERMLSGELDLFSSERMYVRKDGSAVWVNRTVSLARDPLGKPLYFIRIVEDITGRKQAEANLKRLARARHVMAECSRVLVHAGDETAMLQEMCRVAVESGGYKMAWVGIATGDAVRPICPAAHAGFEGDAPMTASAAWGEDGRYQGFMHEVIATGNPHIARNILGDPALARRRARAVQHSFQSSIALPLRTEGGILGAVAIYASEPDAFDADEISLLTGLADDIAFGIVGLRERIARQHAEAAQSESEQRLSLALEGSGQALFDWNVVTGEVFFSPRWNEMVGGDPAPVLSMFDELGRLVHPDDLDTLRASIVESLKSDTLYRVEHRFRNRAGDWIWIQSHGKVTARDAQGRALRLVGYNTDITPRKLAELALAESEERFRATFEQAAVGITHVNLDGVLINVNQKFCDMLGYGRDELMGKTVKDITHPDDYGRGSQYREKLTRSAQESASGEKRFVRKDGGVLWARRTMSTACDKTGKPQYVISIIEDITGRKKAEQQFQDTFDQAAVGIGHVDLDGSYIRVNFKFCEITGYPESELIGFSSAMVSHPGDIGSGNRARMQLLAGEIGSYANEKRYLRKDGATIWVNRTESLARDEAGKPLYFIRVIEDITRRKAAEAERTRLSLIVENASDAIIGRALDGTITSWNAAAERMFGYSGAEMIGQPISILVPEQHRHLADNNERLKRGEMIPASERIRVTKDGRIIHVQSGISPIKSEDGEVIGAAVIVRDISERKRLESRFRDTFEQAAVGIIHTSLDGRYLRVNRKLCDITGYTEEELTSASQPRLSHPDDVESGGDDRRRLLAGEISSHSNEKRYLRKDGSQIWVNRTESLARDEAGNPLYLIRVIEDITERRRADEVAARERALLRTVVDNLPDRIYAKDTEGRFLLQNAANAMAHGAGSPDELLGKTVYDVFSRETAQRVEAEDRAIIESGKPLIERERGSTDAAGNTRWVVASKVPLRDAAGRIFGLVGMNRDITDRKLSALRREMEHAVTKLLAESATVDEAMPKLLRTICQAMNWAYGARWLCSTEGIRRIEYWADFEPEFEAIDGELWLRQGIEGSNVLLRRAWRHKEPTWIVDVERHAAFRRRPSALKFGLHGAFAFPLVVGGDVIGLMEFFGRDARQPDEMLLQVVHAIGSQIGQFMQRKEAERALRASEERYRDVFEASPLPMWVWDDETLDILAVNQAAIEHYGYSKDEFLRMNVREIWAPGEASRYEQNIRGRKQLQALNLKRRHRTRDGRIIDSEVTARLFILGGRAVWLTLANDVSVRVRAEAALRESEEQFRQLSGNIPQVFWITDVSRRQTLYVSPAAEGMLGRPLQDILSDRRALVRAVHKEDRARVYAARRAAVESGYDETYRIQRPDGSIRWVHDRAFPVRDGEGRIYRIAGIAEDVTDRKLAEERLEHLAHYDALTSLPNRALFYDRLKQALLHARRNRWTAGVMFIDADRFKNVNDTLGHSIGDMLLQQIAGRLTRAVRSGDTVGRLGGDEFAIVLSTLASAQDATLVAQKIMAAFNEPFRLDGIEVYVTVSIGITLYPDDSSDLDILVKNADAAMYRAKEIGRNGYQFYMPEMNARAIELLGMESSLRRALERNEFLLHYQPKASIADGDVTGLEALLRWKHPERGLVSPAEFIPLLEESGLIVQVGDWVLRAVCSQIKAWERGGGRLVPVAVNLSARQFAAKDLGPTIKRILEEHQVDPALIELEITESSLMANTEEAVRTLEYLDRLGVGLSIDDFGTGYSSLGYLKRFPISALKIDRAFVRDVTTDGDDATITRAVISLAHSLGLKVIAEGVETRAQLQFLAEYGCNEIQGYYFSRPLAAEDCSAWIGKQHRLERPRPASDVGEPVVLLLDDDEDTLANAQGILARDGYRILAARNAREGFALLRDHRVDVVVSDQNMPGMSGVDFLQCVQTLSPNTMRILATSYADFQTMADAVNKGGIFRCLPKDTGDDALRAGVREAMQVKTRALENSIPPGTLGK